jgi:hypothetical protein
MENREVIGNRSLQIPNLSDFSILCDCASFGRSHTTLPERIANLGLSETSDGVRRCVEKLAKNMWDHKISSQNSFVEIARKKKLELVYNISTGCIYNSKKKISSKIHLQVVEKQKKINSTVNNVSFRWTWLHTIHIQDLSSLFSKCRPIFLKYFNIFCLLKKLKTWSHRSYTKPDTTEVAPVNLHYALPTGCSRSSGSLLPCPALLVWKLRMEGTRWLFFCAYIYTI